MKPVYITSVGCISPQETFDNARFLDTVREYEDNVLSVVDPVYKDYIPPAAARRMAKGIKMGVVASGSPWTKRAWIRWMPSSRGPVSAVPSIRKSSSVP